MHKSNDRFAHDLGLPESHFQHDADPFAPVVKRKWFGEFKIPEDPGSSITEYSYRKNYCDGKDDLLYHFINIKIVIISAFSNY